MKSFTYINAESEPAAIKALNEKSRPLAGGTDLLNLMKDYAVAPDALVNIKGIKETNVIDVKADSWTLGANVTIASALEIEGLQASFPALYQALYDIATPQIRNMATLGGNLCSRPRCWYFRQELFDCLKRGGKICSAIEGDNEFHAIFGTDEPCVIVHPSNTAPALVAYGAKLRIAGRNGIREISAEEFFAKPSADIARENVLQADELLTHIMIPSFKGKSASYEVRHKESHAWPIALASVALSMSGSKVDGARVCLGAVAPIPWRVPKVEEFLKGKEITEKTAEEAGSIAVRDAKPLSQNKYKIQVAKTVVKRALLAASTGKRV